ncbi:MAG: hypothetical protein V3U30_02805 [Thermoplasmata archaeon]
MRRGIVAVLVAVAIAVALGLLEAAWTGPGRGAPTNTWLGVGAILIILAAVTWPRLWWIPGLAILEEGVHLMAGYALLPTWARVLRHWSIEFVGFNLYPWLLFPLLTVAGEFLAWWIPRLHLAKPGHSSPAGTESNR